VGTAARSRGRQLSPPAFFLVSFHKKWNLELGQDIQVAMGLCLFSID
jgi:hypothetical protein